MEALSAYEKRRMQNIERNRQILRNLELVPLRCDIDIPKKRATGKKRKSSSRARSENVPLRRSKRSRKAVVSYSDDWHGEANDGDEEYEVPDGNESEDSVDEIPKPRKKRSVKTSCTTGCHKGNEVGVFRKLLNRDPSADGAGVNCARDLRVGMKAWIVGRNAMTGSIRFAFASR